MSIREEYKQRLEKAINNEVEETLEEQKVALAYEVGVRHGSIDEEARDIGWRTIIELSEEVKEEQEEEINEKMKEGYQEMHRAAEEDEPECQAERNGEKCGREARKNLKKDSDEEDFWVCETCLFMDFQNQLGRKLSKAE